MKKMILAALTVVTLLQGPIAQAKNNQQAGGIIGGVVGAVIGNQIGGGNGRVIATGIGAIAGAMIGSSVGQSMDERDRAALADAQDQALYESRINRPYSWSGNNYRGNFYVTRHGYYRSSECRSYRSEVYGYNGAREIRSGTTCYGSQGWYEVHESYVQWSR